MRYIDCCSRCCFLWFCWQVLHFFTIFSICWSICGQKNISLALYLVLSIPIWAWCNGSNTFFLITSGMTSLSPLNTIPLMIDNSSLNDQCDVASFGMLTLLFDHPIIHFVTFFSAGSFYVSSLIYSSLDIVARAFSYTICTWAVSSSSGMSSVLSSGVCMTRTTFINFNSYANSSKTTCVII